MQPDAMKEFSSFDVMKILDLKRERLRKWMHYEYVIPTKPADGRGTKSIFRLIDVYNVALFKKLVDAGMYRSKAKIYMLNRPELSDYNSAKEINYVLFITGRGGYEKFITIKDKSYTMADIDEGMPREDDWDLGIIINFKNLMEEVNGSIKLL